MSGINLGLLLSAGGTRVVQLRDASFGFVFTADGIAGALFDAAFTGPDFGGDLSLSGEFSALVNTTGVPVSQLIGASAETTAVVVGDLDGDGDGDADLVLGINGLSNLLFLNDSVVIDVDFDAETAAASSSASPMPF